MNSVQVPISLPNLPEEYPDYSLGEYWATRHQTALNAVKGKTLPEMMTRVKEEWYFGIDELLRTIYKTQNLFDENQKQQSEAEICIIGTGFSDVSQQLVQRGFSNIVNIDFSEPCIEFQTNLIETLPI